MNVWEAKICELSLVHRFSGHRHPSARSVRRNCKDCCDIFRKSLLHCCQYETSYSSNRRFQTVAMYVCCTVFMLFHRMLAECRTSSKVLSSESMTKNMMYVRRISALKCEIIITVHECQIDIVRKVLRSMDQQVWGSSAATSTSCQLNIYRASIRAIKRTRPNQTLKCVSFE